MKSHPLFLLLLAFFWTKEGLSQEKLYSEKYRPQFHFSPAEGWIGDPCGFIYYNDMYHMFWWGKVVSDNLVHYEEKSQMVMEGDDGNIAYFTGSVVVDKENTAGFGVDAFVAIYTIFNKENENQSQGISYSHDGESFQYFEENPVLDIGSTEFRDPTVFWHEPTSRWVMSVAMARERKIKFYSSKDLKEWNFMSDFGPYGEGEVAWECSDLFQLNVDGDPNNMKWVMVISVDWNQEQYFIGEFDGTTFTLDENYPEEPLLLDHGMDSYASRTFRDYDGTLSTTTLMGWVATWEYAQHAPSKWGKGFWSLPKALELKTYPEGVRLIQRPVENLKMLRGKPVSFTHKLEKGARTITEFNPETNVYEIEATFTTRNQHCKYGFNLLVGDGREVEVAYNTSRETLSIDRTNTSDSDIPDFQRKTSSVVESEDGKLRLHIFVDKSSIEIFTNEGKEVFTLLTYPGEEQRGIEIFSDKAGVSLDFKAWELQSIWSN